jgi:hypothetical protein
MIVIIKGRNPRQIIVKTFSTLFIFIMFYLYYGHMSEKFSNQNKELITKLEIKQDTKKSNLKKKYENIIYKEAVIVVDLLEQKHIESIEIKHEKLFIVCDYDTNLEAVMIRYGANALIKHTSKNIKIALDLKIIVENKYEI